MDRWSWLVLLLAISGNCYPYSFLNAPLDALAFIAFDFSISLKFMVIFYLKSKFSELFNKLMSLMELVALSEPPSPKFFKV